MSSEPTTVEKLRALPYSYASNAALAVFIQLTFFGSVFVLFLNTLGLDKAQIGFLLSLMPFAGILSLFVAPTVARLGYKRAWITFFSARTAVTALLVLTPLVVTAYGTQAAMVFVSVVVLVFALLRTVGAYAGFPWTQEYVPNSLRGKYTAMNNIFSTLAGFLAVSLASVVLATTIGLTGYTFLIAVGVVFGFISVGLAVFIPGGAPLKHKGREVSERRSMGEALRDGPFIRYLVGVGLFTLATVPLASFLPLYMQDEVGLNASQVVLLSTGTMLGSLFSSYLWGWTADRFGGRPVALYGLTFRILLPVLWLLIPRYSVLSLPAALVIAVLQGVSDVGWVVGSSRLLYVSVVPLIKRAGYMALYWAWLGLAGGFSQLIGGRILDMTQDISGQVAMFTLDPYTPLFLLSILVAGLAILVLRHIRDDSTVGMGQFAGIVLRGNPFLALESMLRFHFVRDEEGTVRVTEKLGTAKSLLTVEELLEALADPRFNVRFEALISIGHMRSDERLTQALVDVLNGSEPALSVLAAWALGRMGDERGVIPLREALISSNYRSVKAHSSRSLGALGDRESIDLLQECLERETDHGLQVALASTLGQLGVAQVTDRLLALLDASCDEPSRLELALALARIVGHEHYFVQLHRQARREPGTATAQAVLALRKQAGRSQGLAGETLAAMDDCARLLSKDELDEGLRELSRVIPLFPGDSSQEPHGAILEHCARRLDELGSQRLEYAILALHTARVR